ncbi:hypothetical protein [Actinacidiphila sp. bgisy160]|uniref:hypothetical protein n=1 Tax=Actinacidiphila sp. bgisy160 TaxID=3413796 RepID=UPI003D75F2F3
MRPGQWRLTYSARGHMPGADLTFGTEDTGMLLTQEPDITFGDANNGEQPLPGEDGIRFGRDYVGPMSVTFEAAVSTWGPNSLNTVTEAAEWIKVNALHLPTGTLMGRSNQNALSKLRSIWRADAVRAGAGTVASLYHETEARTRVAYGRPRRFAPAHSKLFRQGYTPVVADFQCADDRWYDSAPKVATIQKSWRPFPTGPKPIPPPAIGLARGSVTMLGDMSTWPVITINGPAVNPVVWIGDQVKFKLLTFVKPGDWVRVDPRPWVRTVRNAAGTSMGHLLDRSSTRLAEMFVPPGTYSFGADFDFGTGAWGPVTCSWQDAYGWF